MVFAPLPVNVIRTESVGIKIGGRFMKYLILVASIAILFTTSVMAESVSIYDHGTSQYGNYDMTRRENSVSVYDYSRNTFSDITI